MTGKSMKSFIFPQSTDVHTLNLLMSTYLSIAFYLSDVITPVIDAGKCDVLKIKFKKKKKFYLDYTP